MRVAIIIPTLNEEDSLTRRLPGWLNLADEVVVSDGGSSDNSVAVAQQLGAIVVHGPAMRGTQLNRGAEQSTSDVLLFLHADTELPPGALDLIRDELKAKDSGLPTGETVSSQVAVSSQIVGGGFRLRFGSKHPIMWLAGRLINLRTRWSRCPLGDQGQFVRRKTFLAMGGYRDWPILEDLDFSRRLKREGKTVLIQQEVVTSARRYLNRGIGRTLVTNWLIFGLYFLGYSPHKLARLYRHVR